MRSPFVPPTLSHPTTALLVASTAILGAFAAGAATLPSVAMARPQQAEAPAVPAAPGADPSGPVDAGAQPQAQPEPAPAPAAALPLPERRGDARRDVAYLGAELPGTIVVDTRRRVLLLVEPGGRARRYGVAVGRPGKSWTGRVLVGRKVAWPRWTPTPAMLRRDPDRYARMAAGVAPGLTNPLGARALYLYRDGADTMFRIHGTSDTGSIGRGASSGCIRMSNRDVVDLFGRVPVGTAVVVGDGAGQPRSAAAE